MKITSKAVAALALPDGKSDVIHFDDELRGFGYRLRLGSEGTVRKTWVAQYRRAGATRRVLLGAGEVLSAEQARAAARKILAEVALGRDPQADKADRRSKDKLSLRAMIDEFLLAKEGEVRPRTFVEVRRYLTGPHFKALHSMPVDGVTRKDVASQLVAMARQRGSQTAVRARSVLSNFFSWCMRMGITESNPVIGTLQPKGAAARERVLTDAELVCIWNACGDDDYGKIVRLLILLGCRRQEIGGIAVSELDRERGTWTLPATRSKNARSHTLPLMPMALDIIESMPHMASRDQLFGSRSDAGFSAWAEGKAALDERTKITEPWVLHDIRRTVATKMADIGVAPHIIEQILGHVSGHKSGVAGVYNRSSYEREVRAALVVWSDRLRTLVDGGERKVLTFPAEASR